MDIFVPEILLFMVNRTNSVKKEIIDKLVKGKKVVISTTVSYEVRDSYDEPYAMEIFNSDIYKGAFFRGIIFR